MKSNLKACPFCGESVGDGSELPRHNSPDKCYLVALRQYIENGRQVSQEEIDRLWNTRANEETPRERFRREYRETRLLSRCNSRKAMERNSIKETIYAFRVFDKMSMRGALSFRLACYKVRKKAGI